MTTRPIDVNSKLDVLADSVAKPLGEFLIAAGRLRREDADRVHQNQLVKHFRFGESAVELGLVTPDDVKFALAMQFASPASQSSATDLPDELICAVTPQHPTAAAIYRIRATLLLQHKLSSGPIVFAVVGAERGEGRTFLAANLAIAFAQVQARTTLVDGDMRTGRVNQIFVGPDSGGLAATLMGRGTLHDLAPVNAYNMLSVIPAGVAPSPEELLSTPRFRSVVQNLAGRNDVVIFDTPALSAGADAQLIAAEAGLALVITHLGRSSKKSFVALQKALGQTGARLLAVPFKV